VGVISAQQAAFTQLDQDTSANSSDLSERNVKKPVVAQREFTDDFWPRPAAMR
jgi:hypothetical protein